MPAKKKARRKGYDWETIEVAYRAGLRSIMAIAEEHGCSDTAIRKKAKELGWQRDKTAKVKAAVRARLSGSEKSSDGSESSGSELSPEAEARGIEREAELRAGIIRRHRDLAERAQAQVRAMLEQLEHANLNQDDDADAIIDECAKDKNGLRRSRMLQSVSLPSRSGVIVNLANALTKITALEREAWGLVEDAAPEIVIRFVQGDTDA